MAAQIKLLSVNNHDRDSAGLHYVYPVVSRRAGGVSIGVNLNPNNACNWACIYCQVPDLTRGGPPPLDLTRLEAELNGMLDQVLLGDFMRETVPEGARRLMDVAFSGNGEPTSAPEFADAMALVARILADRGLNHLKLRLITNGSLIRRRYVQEGLRSLARANGEVWFKLDAADSQQILMLNGVQQKVAAALARLQICAELVPTWVQTCVVAIDGNPPVEAQIESYLTALAAVGEKIKGVLLYGLARPSMQPESARLTPVSAEWMDGLAARIAALGIKVNLNL